MPSNTVERIDSRLTALRGALALAVEHKQHAVEKSLRQRVERLLEQRREAVTE